MNYSYKDIKDLSDDEKEKIDLDFQKDLFREIQKLFGVKDYKHSNDLDKALDENDPNYLFRDFISCPSKWHEKQTQLRSDNPKRRFFLYQPRDDCRFDRRILKTKTGRFCYWIDLKRFSITDQIDYHHNCYEEPLETFNTSFHYTQLLLEEIKIDYIKLNVVTPWYQKLFNAVGWSDVLKQEYFLFSLGIVLLPFIIILDIDIFNDRGDFDFYYLFVEFSLSNWIVLFFMSLIVYLFCFIPYAVILGLRRLNKKIIRNIELMLTNHISNKHTDGPYLVKHEIFSFNE